MVPNTPCYDRHRHWPRRDVRDDVIAIPKAASVACAQNNRAAADIVLTAEELARLDRIFPRPQCPIPLKMLYSAHVGNGFDGTRGKARDRHIRTDS